MNYKGSVALITGASRGIGRAIAVRLAREGVNLALSGRDEAALKETQSLCQGAESKVFPCDLSSNPTQAHELVDQVVKEMGGLKILVNNAGILERGRAGEADLKRWDLSIDLNLRSLVHLTHHALQPMKTSPGGAIINIASVAGKSPSGNVAIYNATKFGVVGFTGALFEDVREYGIKACAICPGFVKTEMVGDLGLVPEKMIQPEDIAETAWFVINAPETCCPTEILVRPQRSPFP